MGAAPLAEAGSRRARRLNVALVALMWLAAFALYDLLPERFPIHFDLAGNPDGWAERGSGGLVLWLLLPAVATLMLLLMRWAPRAARSNPHLWNMPRKRDFLALEPERREPIHALLTVAMDWMALLVTLMLATLEALMFVSARTSGSPAWSVIATLFAMCIAVLVIAHRAGGRVNRAIDAAARAHASNARTNASTDA